MSYFVRLPGLPNSAAIPMYLDGSAVMDGRPCVVGARATDAELADNAGAGINMRIGVVTVDNSPTVYALYAVVRGIPHWITYDPTAATLVFSESLLPGSEFRTQVIDAATGGCYLFNEEYNVYLTTGGVTDDGRVLITGTPDCNELCSFVFDCALGTGALMPSYRYFVSSVFGMHLTVRGDTLAQTTDDGAAEQFLVEAGDRTNMTRRGAYYRLRAADGRYVTVTPDATIAMSADGGAAATFTIMPSSLARFTLTYRHEIAVVRAKADGTVTTGSAFDVAIPGDAFMLQCVRDPAPTSASRRARPVVLAPCDRTDAEQSKGGSLVDTRRQAVAALAKYQAGEATAASVHVGALPHHLRGLVGAVPRVRAAPSAAPRSDDDGPTAAEMFHQRAMAAEAERLAFKGPGPRPIEVSRPIPSARYRHRATPVVVEGRAAKRGAGEPAGAEEHFHGACVGKPAPAGVSVAAVPAAAAAPTSLLANRWLLAVLVCCFLAGLLLAAQLYLSHRKAAGHGN